MASVPVESDAPELALVLASLARWPGLEGATATLVNLSENHSFRLDLPDGGRFILRLHRPRYQSRTAIQSELDWLVAVARDTAIPVPRPIAGVDGALVQEVAPERYAALFAFETGTEPAADSELAPLFTTLGRYAATLHLQVAGWPEPTPFVRPIWDAVGILEPAGLWGDWRKAPGVEGDTLDTLTALDTELRRVLADYGTDIDRFGLIHADMRLGNILIDGERTVLLDFDDSGHGWFLYDLAASLSFIETSAQVPALIRAWLAGYMAVRPLKAEDVRMVDALILLRRMALLAWIGTHGETTLAQAHADRFALDTAEMARKYLARE